MNSIPGPILRAIESLHLPAMPQILLRFLEEAGRENASLDTLAQLVMQDPALSARMLTVANSAAFRRGSELRGIKQSLMALGTRMVRTIASCLVVQSVFARLSDARPQDLAGFWRHSLLVAELARSTAQELGATDGESEEAYLAGLLHDVGQLVLLGGLGKAYGTLLSSSETEAELVGNEQPVLATDHAAVGAWVVDQWQLPSLMADAILFHHWDANQVATADRLTRVLWAAHQASLAPPAAWDDASAIGPIQELTGIATTRFRVLRDGAAQRVDSIASALGVSEAPPQQTLPQWAGEPGHGGNGHGDEEAATEDAESRLMATASAMAALQPLQQNFASGDDDADLLVAVRESARILFGVQRLALLLVQPEDATLSGRGIVGQPAALARLEVGLESGSSLCADAGLSRQPRSTFDSDSATAPADVQIARALGGGGAGGSASDGLLYIPMSGPGALVGVMVCGVSTVQHARLRKRQAWLQSFAAMVAGALQASSEARERQRRTEADAAARFRLHGQKVAHEAANPLGIIRNYLTIVDLKLPDSKALGQDIAVLREEIERVSTIIRQLGEDAAPAAAATGALDLNALVEGMRALYGESLFGARGVSLELQPSIEPALARADRDSVKQILFNLWKNASEAVPEGGLVTTSVATGVNQNGLAYLELAVSDNGPGLPADVLQSLYQPLGASRRPGRSGLGLSIVRSLVDTVQGHISCRSRTGHGSSFAVLLPASERVDG